MRVKDPISALTHLIGMIFSCIALVLLVKKAIEIETMVYIVGFAIFGLSLILLYAASTVYHTVDKPEEIQRKYKRIDHMMIYVLIAGTYTPICLIALGGTLGYIMLALIWLIAIAGIIMKIFWIGAPRKITSGLYIIMGWLVIFAISPIAKSLPQEGLKWLVAGGIIYTIGGVIYALKWPFRNNKWFGFHELFHLFVMGGSVCHYILVIQYI